jgi:phage regulator Rha-like protein
MLDFDLAEMYQVETRVLNQSVKRNIQRFPEDFMFSLSPDEWENMSSQFVMTYPAKRPKASPPLAFSEHGVTMLASVLRSEKAIRISIQIVRAFIAIRTYLAESFSISKEIAELRERVNALEAATEENLKEINDLSEDTGSHLDDIYIALSELADRKKALENKPRRSVGFIRQRENQGE